MTAPLLRELNDHIDMYETQGPVEILDSGDNYTAATRKGVEIEYVTKNE